MNDQATFGENIFHSHSWLRCFYLKFYRYLLLGSILTPLLFPQKSWKILTFHFAGKNQTKYDFSWNCYKWKSSRLYRLSFFSWKPSVEMFAKFGARFAVCVWNCCWSSLPLMTSFLVDLLARMEDISTAHFALVQVDACLRLDHLIVESAWTKNSLRTRRVSVKSTCMYSVSSSCLGLSGHLVARPHHIDQTLAADEAPKWCLMGGDVRDTIVW